MKTSLTFLISLIAAAAAIAADGPPSPSAPPVVNALFRVLKADGTTVVGQAVVAPGGGALATINVKQADAIVAANGRCAFNVKYDEVASAALKGTVNRLYSNDTLIAQNSAIDLQAGVLKTIWTQPYLYAGQNNVKVILNATGVNPSTGWVRVNVDGTCGSTVVTPPKVEPPKSPASAPPTCRSMALFCAIKVSLLYRRLTVPFSAADATSSYFTLKAQRPLAATRASACFTEIVASAPPPGATTAWPTTVVPSAFNTRKSALTTGDADVEAGPSAAIAAAAAIREIRRVREVFILRPGESRCRPGFATASC